MLPERFFSKYRFTHAIAAILLIVFIIPVFIAPLQARAVDAGSEYEVLLKEAAEADKLGKTSKLELTKVGCKWTEIACGSLWFLNLITDGIIFLVYPLGEGFFLTMVEYNYSAFNTPDHPLMLATKTGWDITLGIANMFFVLLLLWIAIGTIFDFEPWTARQLLPKLIIAALLINFSLAIGTSIIRLSNGIATIFSLQIEKMGGTGAAIMNIYNPDEILYAMQNQYTSLNKDELTKKLKEWKVKITNSGIPWKNGDYSALDCYMIIQDRTGLVSGSLAGLGDFLINFGTAGNYISSGAHIEAACRKFVADIEIAKALSALDPTFGKTHILAMSLAAKVFVIPIALFTIFAAGVMLLVRLISLLMLLIFGPLVFLFFAFGPLKSYWTKWWENLFKWSFFMPTFMFLFMMSLIILKGVAPKSADLALVGGKIPNVGELVVYYLIAVGLMIGSLMVGHQAGIAGAGAVTGLGKRWAGTAGKLARRGAFWPARVAGRRALSKAGEIAHEVEGGKFAGNLMARGLMKVPGVRRGLQNVAVAARKQIDDFIKDNSSKSSLEMGRIARMITTSNAARSAIVEELIRRRDTDDLAAIPVKLEQLEGESDLDFKLRQKIEDEKTRRSIRDPIIKQAMAYAESIGEDVINYKRGMPSLSGNVGAIARSIRSEHLPLLEPEEINREEVALAFLEHTVSGFFDAMQKRGGSSAKNLQAIFEGKYNGVLRTPGESEESFASRQGEFRDRALEKLTKNTAALKWFTSKTTPGGFDLKLTDTDKQNMIRASGNDPRVSEILNTP